MLQCGVPFIVAILRFALNPNKGMLQYEWEALIQRGSFALNPNKGMLQCTMADTQRAIRFALNPNKGMLQFKPEANDILKVLP